MASLFLVHLCEMYYKSLFTLKAPSNVHKNEETGGQHGEYYGNYENNWSKSMKGFLKVIL